MRAHEHARLYSQKYINKDFSDHHNTAYMKALIFAAGLGTRLRPLTDTMPKALVPINGKPLLGHLIEKLKQCGFNDIVINIHHFPQQIRDYVAENRSFGIDIKFSDESRMLLETGGGVRKAAPLFSRPLTPILLHNVDIMSNADLARFYADNAGANVNFHGAMTELGASLLVSPRTTSRYLLFDDNGLLVGWENIKTGQVRSPYEGLDPEKCRKYAFSGIHVFSPSLLESMNEWKAEKFSIIDFYLAMCAKVPIRGVVDENLKLVDVGKFETLASVEKYIEENGL